jgi:hypothetical protein
VVVPSLWLALARPCCAGGAVLSAAVGVAAQLFRVLQAAHTAGLTSPATYLLWAERAAALQQHKVSEHRREGAARRCTGSFSPACPSLCGLVGGERAARASRGGRILLAAW